MELVSLLGGRAEGFIQRIVDPEMCFSVDNIYTHCILMWENARVGGDSRLVPQRKGETALNVINL